MADLTIITNGVPRDVLEAWDLTPAERTEFDYLDWAKLEAGEDSASFFRYKGEIHDLGEFQAVITISGVAGIEPFQGWDGFTSDTFFSGLLVRYVEDFERVVVGRYYS